VKILLHLQTKLLRLTDTVINPSGVNPKNYPHRTKLLELLKEHDITEITQNIPLEESIRLVRAADVIVSIDSYLNHLCWYLGKKAIVIFGPSDPRIFGHNFNVNLLQDRKYLRPDQFIWWEKCVRNDDAFPFPEMIVDEINKLYAERDIQKSKCAIFTMCKNDQVFLSIWLKYYRKWFREEDIYFLDHDSIDGSTKGLLNVTEVHNLFYDDHEWLTPLVKKWQTILLDKYEYVLFAQPDEIIVADPQKYAGLGDYIEKLKVPVVRCLGKEVVQNLSSEGSIDWSKPLLDQRRYWAPSWHSSKTLLSSYPLDWAHGFHNENNVPERPIDSSLYLVHLHRVDLQFMLERHHWKKSLPLKDPQSQLGFHDRWSDNEIMEDYSRFIGMLEPIPAHINGNIL
jgi:hypothetical protein